MRKAHDGPHANRAAGQQSRSERDVRRLYANRPGAVAHGQLAAAANLVAGQLRTQQRVVDQSRDLAHSQLARNDPGGGHAGHPSTRGQATERNSITPRRKWYTPEGSARAEAPEARTTELSGKHISVPSADARPNPEETPRVRLSFDVSFVEAN